MSKDVAVQELYEYKNLGVLKNYVSSFASNVDNIESTKKAGMTFSSNFNHHKINPLVYVKFWRQACLPSLLFGTELFTLNATHPSTLNTVSSGFSKTFSMSPALLLTHSYLLF